MTTAREQLIEALNAYQIEAGTSVGKGSSGCVKGIFDDLGMLRRAETMEEEGTALGSMLGHMLRYCQIRGLKLSDGFLFLWEGE
jgi:hypothetical protein